MSGITHLLRKQANRLETTVTEDHTLFALRVVAALAAIVRHATAMRAERR